MLFLLLFSFLLLVLCFSVSIVHSTLVSCFLIQCLVPHCVWSAKRQYFGFSARNIVYPHSWCSLMHEFIWVFRLIVYLSRVEFSLYTYTIYIIQNHILYSIDYYIFKITQCSGASMYYIICISNVFAEWNMNKISFWNDAAHCSKYKLEEFNVHGMIMMMMEPNKYCQVLS